MKEMTCFMCQKRPAKPLTAMRDDMVYKNAQNVKLFCGVRCAANYALLLGSLEIETAHHWCKPIAEWRHWAEAECHICENAPKDQDHVSPTPA